MNGLPVELQWWEPNHLLVSIVQIPYSLEDSEKNRSIFHAQIISKMYFNNYVLETIIKSIRQFKQERNLAVTEETK